VTRIECFMLEETDIASSELRRYVRDKARQKCTVHPWGYHNACVALENVEWPAEQRWHVRASGERMRIGGTGSGPLRDARDDPRWPVSCVCGYVFQPDDEWQHNLHQLYRVPHTGELVEVGEVGDHQSHIPKAPPGAMWIAWWYSDIKEWCGPDGRALMLMTPAGSWHIDGPSRNGNGWTRSGVPPKVTANPSILIGDNRYHGWLRDGWLEEC
jgi:hypothetical protein